MKLLTTKEAAKLLNRTPCSVTVYAKKGLLPFTRINGGHGKREYRFRPLDVANFDPKAARKYGKSRKDHALPAGVLGISEVADRLNYTRAAVQYLVQQGTLEARKYGIPWGITEKALENYQALHRIEPQPQQPTIEPPTKSYTREDFPIPMVELRDGTLASYTIEQATAKGLDWVSAGHMNYVPAFTRQTRTVTITETLDADGNVVSTEEEKADDYQSGLNLADRG